MFSPSLPQNDGPLEQAERVAQLLLYQATYQYDASSPLPMPMGTPSAAIAELPALGGWIAGQAKNQATILANQQIWTILQRFSAGELSAEAATSAIQAVTGGGPAQVSISGPAAAEADAITKLAAQQNAIAAAAAALTGSFRSLAAYASVFPLYQVPEIVEQWEQDRIFASQRLGGLNPMIIRLVTLDGAVGAAWPALRAKLSAKVNDAAVGPFLGTDATLDMAVANGDLFVADYDALGRVTGDPNAPGWQRGRRIMAPIALYVRTGGFDGLQLVAIQLDQGPNGADGPAVMLAADAGKPGQANNWLLAKMCVQSADLSYNQAVNHLGQTHLIEEAFALATRRQLALQHPLNILLSKHFAAVLVINQLGALTLLKAGPDGLLNQVLAPGMTGSLELITNQYNAWHFDQLDFPSDIQSRGMTVANLPYFPYRDDGTDIWNVLGNYVRDYLGLYYTADTDVTRDYELQNWAKELSREVGGAGNVPGFKPSIDSIQELIDIVQKLIWTASAQHAAVNFPQIEYASFMPNYPGATFTPPPPDFQHVRTQAEDLLATLPPASNTLTQMSVTYALAGYHYDTLLDYADQLEPNASAVCRRYHDQLVGEIQDRIVARNCDYASTRGLLPYPYLLPANIPNSTSV